MEVEVAIAAVEAVAIAEVEAVVDTIAVVEVSATFLVHYESLHHNLTHVHHVPVHMDQSPVVAVVAYMAVEAEVEVAIAVVVVAAQELVLVGLLVVAHFVLVLPLHYLP